MKFEVLILGSSSATPMYGRHPTSQLINIDEQFLLIDCGEGTQMQLVKFGIKSNRIKHIFISHLHGDHYFGLMGLISSMHLVGRKDELHIYGPPGLKEILELQFLHSQTILRYPLHFHPTQTTDNLLILDTNKFSVSTFPLDHRIVCTGFRIDVKSGHPRINVEVAESRQVPKTYYGLLKAQVDYVSADGDVTPWQELTLPPDPPKSYAFCSDTIDSGTYLDAIDSVNLLYHEATFLHDMVERATETFHTTALQAGGIAQRAQAEKLLIGHYSARYKTLEALLDEARSVFPDTALAVEGRWYPV